VDGRTVIGPALHASALALHPIASLFPALAPFLELLRRGFIPFLAQLFGATLHPFPLALHSFAVPFPALAPFIQAWAAWKPPRSWAAGGSGLVG
jgi:hypothetical protein